MQPYVAAELRVRFSLRIFSESQTSSQLTRHGARRVLIVGAADAGALVVREMQKNPDLHLTPVCYVDDDTSKQRQQIHGVPVMGTISDLPRLVAIRRINEVIIAIPSAPGRMIRQVSDTCRTRGIPFRTMPGIYELIGVRSMSTAYVKWKLPTSYGENRPVSTSL